MRQEPFAHRVQFLVDGRENGSMDGIIFFDLRQDCQISHEPGFLSVLPHGQTRNSSRDFPPNTTETIVYC